PALARTSPQPIFTRVDLPAPLGPRRPTSSPSSTATSTPPSAFTFPYCLASPRAEKATATARVYAEPTRSTLPVRLGFTVVPVCSNCGQENPDVARFCLACGAPLVDAGAAREERKIVTVLFADLVGFTSRAEQLDPEDVRA